VEEEVHKERRSHAGERGESVDDAIFQRIYGKGWRELLDRFRDDCSLPAGDSISYSDWKSFTYWLFKYRVNNCDKARVASDTRKALLQISQLEEIKQRRLKRRR
jgi:hypothetical protein